MNAATLVGYVLVPLFGVFLCIAPLLTRPTVQFGVRVPPAHLTAPVIRRARRGFLWLSAVVAICATAVLIAVGSDTPWTSRLILIVEILLDFGCYWWTRQRIVRVKSAEDWFAGQRQTIVADTSWRAEPPRFPVGWLVPAVTVIAATVVIGILRYPQLPAHLSSGGHQVATSPVNAFAVIIGQLYVTGVWTGVLVLAYRSRPDLDTGDPAASLRGYRTALRWFARAALVLLACIDLTLFLSGLQKWQVVRLPAVLIGLPAALGLVTLIVTVVLAARERARAVGPARAVDRDDDRFWKAGFVYVNRDDPAVLVSARIAVGWTPNLGNPTARLLVAGFLSIPIGLVILKYVTGT
jgi:uncharacterized membrane protein